MTTEPTEPTRQAARSRKAAESATPADIAAKPTAAKKAATKKSATGKAATKKAATKQTATKQTATKQVATKQVATKQVATKQVATKKAATNKAATRTAANKASATPTPQRSGGAFAVGAARASGERRRRTGTPLLPTQPVEVSHARHRSVGAASATPPDDVVEVTDTPVTVDVPTEQPDDASPETAEIATAVSA
ncbi:MAG: hypothetical protein HOQ27_02480, partial [Dermatophilaceae bacterium]|nr:hypothetical protein [Dermatophilaceae bacterium]